MSDEYESIVTAKSAEDMLKGKWSSMSGIVRCKDCKFCDRGNCTFWDDGYGAIVSMDDFCSWGERREDA